MNTKTQIKFADYSLFERNVDNLRSDLDCPELKQAILAVGYVTDPVLVHPDLTESGKFLIIEGNRRHFTLDNLSTSESEKVSLKLPYIVLDDPSDARLIQLQLTFGSIDKRLQPREYWQGIQTLLKLEAEANNPEAEEITSDMISKAVPAVSEELSISKQWLYALLKLHNEASEKLLSSLDSRLINFDNAIKLKRAADKYDLNLDFVLNLCIEAAASKGSNVTPKIVNDTIKLLTQPQTELEEEIGEPESVAEEDTNESEEKDNNTKSFDRSAVLNTVNTYMDEVSLTDLSDQQLKKLYNVLKSIFDSQTVDS